MKRFNDSLYGDVYKYFDALENPIKKVPLIKNYPNKKMYFNLLTGKYSGRLTDIMDEENVKTENYKFYKKSQSWTHYFDIKYIKELDALCIRAYAFSFTWDGSFTPFFLRSAKIMFRDKTILDMPEAVITKKGSSAYCYEYVASNIFADKKTIDLAPGSNVYEEIRKLLNSSIKDIERVPYIEYVSYTQKMDNGFKHERELGLNGEKWEDFAKIFTDFYGGNIKTVAAGRIVDISASPKNFGTFIHYKEPKGMKKESVKENKYLSLSLPSIPYKSSYADITGFVQSLTESISILRIMQKDNAKKEMFDISKIFVEKGKVSAFRKNDSGNWVKANLSSISNWKFDVYGIEEKVLDKTLFRFTEDIVKELDKIPYATALALVIGNPIIEQLYKSEAKDIILEILNNQHWETNIKSILKNYFGKIDYNKKSVYQKLGVNKYQFKKIVNIYNNPDAFYGKVALKTFKECFTHISNMDTSYYWRSKRENEFLDISSMDNDTFDSICNVLFSPAKGESMFQKQSRGYWPLICAKVTTLYDMKSAIKVLSLLKEACDTPIAYSFDYQKSHRIVGFYNDYISMVYTISTKYEDATKRFPAFFDAKNFEASITSMHNLVTEIATEIRNEGQAENFRKQVEKLDKWVFDDENFIAIRPEKMADLTEEGIKLHHCVGGYIQRVSNGTTNIMFIRKKEEINKPFFTVEISNSGSIEQIHGLCNCNVEKGSNLEKFVQKWTKEKKLKTTYYDKIR